MHRILERQLRRAQLSADNLPSLEEWQAFLHHIENAYQQFEQDRYLLERSLTLSSKEMRDLYETLEGKVSQQSKKLLETNQDLLKEIEKHTQTEDNLRASEDRLQIVFDNMPEAIYIADMTGVFLDGNRAAEELVGYPREELIGKSFLKLDLLPPSQIPRAAALVARSAMGFATGPDPFTLNRKDGTTRYIEITSYPIKIHGEKRLLGIANDITNYRQTQATMALLEKARQSVASKVELTEVIETVVEAIARTFGYPLIAIYLLDGDVLRLQKQTGFSQTIPEIPVGAGISGRVFQTGKPVFVKDVREDENYVGIIEEIVSEICVPLFDEGQVVGTLNIESTAQHPLNDFDLDLMVALAEHVSIAIGRARLYETINRRQRYLETIRRITQQAIPERDEKAFLQALTDGLVSEFDVTYAGFLLADNEERIISLGNYSGDLSVFGPNEIAKKLSFPYGKGIIGWVAENLQTHYTPDTSKEPMFSPASDDLAPFSQIIAPVKRGSRLLGVLSIASEHLYNFDGLDLEAFSELADELALNLENLRLNQRAAQTAILEERQRIAHEFQDAVTQTMFAASLVSESLPRQWETLTRDQVRGYLEQLNNLIRGAQAEIDTVLTALRPEKIKGVPLDTILRKLSYGVIARALVEVDLQSQGDISMPEEVKLNLYRIAQEVLSNIRKYADAENVDIHLTGHTNHITMLIRDDGRGFDPENIDRQTDGLNNMVKLVEQCGGSISIESAEDAGTSIEVTVPRNWT